MEESQDRVHYDAYEVFIQRHPLAHHEHVGSLVAPSPQLALQVAKENFLRREKAVNIWAVKQDNVYSTSYDDADMFANQVIDKSYREVAGYSDNAQKWKHFKERAISIDDLADDLKME